MSFLSSVLFAIGMLVKSYCLYCFAGWYFPALDISQTQTMAIVLSVYLFSGQIPKILCADNDQEEEIRLLLVKELWCCLVMLLIGYCGFLFK